ncbi:hypothetical protein [Peterkaempfera sp. SMS 1(5)a]|uniref:hypothetical protein n=1 Tax=Peterkaempfera podocarpi TaxID=3232308 RepID=UPI00366A7787
MPATPRPARLASLALVCAALLCGCVSTAPGDVRTTEPARVVAPATPVGHPSPDDVPSPIERYGIAQGDPAATPHAPPPRTATPRRRQRPAPRPRPHAGHIRHIRPVRRPAPAPQRTARQPGVHSGKPDGICDLGTRLGRWAPGSPAERTCHRVYG